MPLVYFSLALNVLFLAFLLLNGFGKTNHSIAQRFLVSTFVLLMLYNLQLLYLYVAHQLNSVVMLSYYFRIDLLVGMAICPSIYLFQQFWMNTAATLPRWKITLHALPLLPALLYIVAFAFHPVAWRVQILQKGYTQLSTLEIGLLVIFYVQLFFYLIWGLKKIWVFRKDKFRVIIGKTNCDIRWLFYLYLIAFVVLLITIPICLLKKCDAYYTVLGIVVVDVLFIYLFFYAFAQTQLITLKSHTQAKPQGPSTYLTEEQLTAYDQCLAKLFIEQPIYLSPKCSLSEVSEMTQIPAHHLSYLLNHRYNLSFPEFINSCRVCYACEQLKSNKVNLYTIDKLYADFGFGSKTNFFRSFKKQTGKTPKSYKESLLNSKE